MGLFFLRLLMTVLADKTVHRAIVLELWERAKRTDTNLDDTAVSAVAAGLGIDLPQG